MGIVRKAEPEDKDLLLTYCEQDPRFNLFAIGDLLHYSLDDPAFEIYIDYSEPLTQESIRGLLMRYFNSVVPISILKNYDFSVFKDKLNTWSYSVLTGKSSLIDKTLKLIDKHRIHERRNLIFCECPELIEPDSRESFLPHEKIDVMQMDDVMQYMDAIRQIEEFQHNQPDKNALESRLNTGAGQIWIIKEEDQIVSGAGTNVETPQSAMIGGVFTLPEIRNQGYASSLMYHLCKLLLDQGKIPCLFFDNPKAGSIYYKLGFKQIGNISMVYVNDPHQMIL